MNEQTTRLHHGARRLSADRKLRSPGSWPCRGFTLLEVIVAVAILGLTSIGIFKFVQSNISAVASSVQDTEQQLAVERLVALVQDEMFNLPRNAQQAAVLGESLTLGGNDFDSMQWGSGGGSGLMTTAATGQYLVKLRIQPLAQNPNKYEIGLWRRPVMLETLSGLVPGGSDSDGTWVPLLENVVAMRIRYWDQRLAQYVDSWLDTAVRPAFFVMSITQEGDDVPYEAVIRIPSAYTQR